VDDVDPLRSNGPATIPDPPNLKGTLLARTSQKLRLDLKELDQFHAADKDDA
jgi:hypothetical protein